MDNPKLLNLLFKLSKQEFLSVEYYLKTPSFNKNQDLISFFEQLKPYAPKFNPKKMKKEDLYALVYPKKKFDNIKFNHLCSLLTIAIQNFLASIEIKKEEYIRERLLLKRYDNKKFSEDFMTENKNFQRHLEQKKPLDLAGYFHSYWLSRALYFHTGHAKDSSLDNTIILKSIIYNLEEFYQLARLEIMCEMANMSRIHNFYFEDEFFDLTFIKNQEIDEYNLKDLKDIYLLVFKIINSSPSQEQLEQVDIVINNLNNIKISKIDKNVILGSLINSVNFAKDKFPREGHEAYFNIVFNLLESGKFNKGSHVDANAIISLIVIGIEIDKIKEIRYLINSYKSKIPEYKKELYVNLIEALYSYGMKDYSLSIEALNRINDKSFGIKGITELLYIRIYFEEFLGKDENSETLLKIHLNRYKKYLQQSNKINESKRTKNFDFVKFMYSLITNVEDLHGNTLSELLIQINNSGTPLKLWLIKKIYRVNSFKINPVKLPLIDCED